MGNLTLRERAIVVGVLLTFIIGAAHRYSVAKARTLAAENSPAEAISIGDSDG